MVNSPPPLTVNVVNEYGSFTIVNTNPDAASGSRQFTLLGFEDFPLQAIRISSVADWSWSMIANGVISEEGHNLAGFGLLNPAATITIRYLDDTSAVLHLGDSAPGGGLYAIREGDPTVYLLFQSVADSFLRRDLDFISLEVTEHPRELPIITRAVLGGSVRPEPIIVEEVTEAQREALSRSGRLMASHLITSPLNQRLNMDSGLEPLAFSYALTAHSVEARFDSPGELSRWGLSEPYSTIEIESSSHESFKLIASEPDENGMVYLVREGMPLVYNVAAASLPWLELDTFTMMDKLLILPFIDTVSVVEVHTPRHDLRIELEGEGQDITVIVNGVPYTAAEGVDPARNFRTFYTDLISANYHAFTDEQLPANPQILLQITYHYHEGGPPDVVTYYEGTARRVFVRLNNETPMLGLSTFLDHIDRSIASFLAGEQVRPFF